MELNKKKFGGKKGRLIPQKKYPRPFRFVGIAIIVMVLIIFILYKLMLG
jgi:uncharacterized membrane protein YukC